jgi:2-enoate reductase
MGTMETKNRVVMAAMGIRGTTDDDGDWGERTQAFYTARAAGGVGVIIPEMVFVSRVLEPAASTCIDLASDRHLGSVRRLADSLHRYDSRLCIQLTAGFGRVVPPFLAPEWWTDDPLPVEHRPVSASINNNHYLPDRKKFDSRPLTTAEVAAHAQAFGFAAMRAREGGADCVELHGHEGYLLDQFMTKLWNRRNDCYGGSREKRLTFAREAIAAIKRDAGDDFPIIYRFGLTHHVPGGREPEEGLWIARQLEQMGVAALHIDAGCYESHWWPHPPQYQEPGCMVSLAEQVRQRVSIPVIAVGRLQDPEVAESVLNQGRADFVAIGRGLLADPDWVNKVESGKASDIIPCISCHEGCLQQMTEGKPTSCALRPTTGHELEWPMLPTEAKASLLVVGGGPAGLEAARAGVERGFDVTLWEAGDKTGGNLWPAAEPDFKLDIARYLTYLRHLEKQLPIDVVLSKRAIAQDVIDFGADFVIVATGAEMEALPFKTTNTVKVLNAIDLLTGMATTGGDRVVVMGGGLVGCETAVHLAHHGAQVTLTTRRGVNELGGDIVDRSNRKMLMQMITDANIRIFENTVPLRTGNCFVIAERNEQEITIAADSLVFAGRLLPRGDLVTELAEYYEDHAGNVFSAGDCIKVGSIMNAVWDSFNAVRKIAA